MFLQCHFKILNISLLTWLRNPSSRFESSPAVISNGINEICSHIGVYHKTSYSSAGPSFSSITMDNSNIIWVLSQKVKHVITRLEQKRQSRRMMVFPWVRLNSMIKLISLHNAVAHIKYHIWIRMICIEKWSNIIDIVSV